MATKRINVRMSDLSFDEMSRVFFMSTYGVVYIRWLVIAFDSGQEKLVAGFKLQVTGSEVQKCRVKRHQC